MKTREEYISLLSAYKEKHADKYGISKMGIFGSVACGENREDSDIDIYYEDKELGLKSMKINTDLEALFEQPVDVLFSAIKSCNTH
ncbi:MAG: nucleotidyltransferase domain-containing protein [Bacteroidales bacterium]|jgi:predicted nucleotidyltransferase|nr:nucleotidyltransferase domain-containing protein [Bacteroidales bacterium]